MYHLPSEAGDCKIKKATKQLKIKAKKVKWGKGKRLKNENIAKGNKLYLCWHWNKTSRHEQSFEKDTVVLSDFHNSQEQQTTKSNTLFITRRKNFINQQQTSSENSLKFAKSTFKMDNITMRTDFQQGMESVS